MKITIINGDMQSEESNFSEYIAQLAEEFRKENEVNLYNLNAMNLEFCRGCWNCWWKTPGKCTTKDTAEQIFRSVINSDFFIFASPLMIGFTSSLLKRITDRLIVLLHPYIKLKHGESHHRKRYEKYPNFGLVLKKETDTDEEDIQIVKNIYDRLALNFHTEQKYLKFISQNTVSEIVYETCHL